MRTFDFKRAATRAALFCCLTLLPVLPLVTASAFAKMRLDRLSIQPTGGGRPQAFDIELATTDQEKSLGLMFRTKLGDSEGMLFPYGAPTEVSMWMRNTYIPLDMVFIRADGTIHRIEVNTEPLSDRVITSGGPVSAVLELAGGATGRLGIKAGDHVNYGIFGAANKP